MQTTDLVDHQNLVRVRIFVSVNGFEGGCTFEQSRIGSAEKILILVTGEDIERFLKSTKDTLEWLEELISSGFK